MNGVKDGSPSPNFDANRPSSYYDDGSQFDLNLNTMSTTDLGNQQYNDAFDSLLTFEQPMPYLSDQQDYSQINLSPAMTTRAPMNTQQQHQVNNSIKLEPDNSRYLEDSLPRSNTEHGLVDYSLYNNNDTSFLDDTSYLNEPCPLQSVNPADIMSDRSSPFSHTTSPPNMLTPDNIQQPFTFPQQTSPFIPNAYTPSPRHSRNVSLGPESAHFPNAQPPSDWSMMPPSQFTNHRRSPSEFSEFSSTSAAHSPNLLHLDSFDSIDHHSPLCLPQNMNAYPDGLELNNFSLDDNSHYPAMNSSPYLSTHVPTQVTPQQQQQFLIDNGIGPNSQIFNAFNNSVGNDQYQIPSLQRNASLEMGQAQQMIPPEINVEFAPTSRQNSFEPPKPSLNEEGLTPPSRGRNRRRAASDVTGSISQIMPASGSGIHLGVTQPAARSLSPGVRLANASSKVSRRQSTSAVPHREYLLNLADPNHQPSTAANGSGMKPLQKHAATFQCTLCPKKFTRAYNLRSHLRTHTDERPFICTVCQKAFARQHDRKRHEGLHTGEKKFVCKGDLQQGGSWGCSRRFARADALGRHFRSEAGRVCIKPLLDEERSRQWQEQQMHNMTQNMHQQQQQQMVDYDTNSFAIDNANFTFPAALLAQYPALATLNWPEIGNANSDLDMDDDEAGMISNGFDAGNSASASASDYYDEDYNSSGGGQSGQGSTEYGVSNAHFDGGVGGYKSDY